MFYLATDKGFYICITSTQTYFTQDIREALPFDDIDSCDRRGKYLVDGKVVQYYAVLTSRI